MALLQSYCHSIGYKFNEDSIALFAEKAEEAITAILARTYCHIVLKKSMNDFKLFREFGCSHDKKLYCNAIEADGNKNGSDFSSVHKKELNEHCAEDYYVDKPLQNGWV